MNNLSNFSEALNELMTLNNLTELSLAEKTGIPVSCISLYVRGVQTPYLENILILADYFNCSIDYLLGFTDTYTPKVYNECPIFAERFRYLLKHYGFRDSKFYKDKQISKSCFYEWKSGKSVPTLDNLIKLAKIFNCTVDYLLGRED